jgi:hypothetical protein
MSARLTPLLGVASILVAATSFVRRQGRHQPPSFRTRASGVADGF